MSRTELYFLLATFLTSIAISFNSGATSVAPRFVADDVFFTGQGEVGLAGSYPNIGGVIRFLSITDQAKRDLSLHNRTVSCAAISSDGLLMASAGDVWTSPCEVFLSNPSTAEIKTRLQGHVGCVLTLAISPNAQVLASGGGPVGGPDSPGELILWDLQTATVAYRLVGHAGMVFGVAFSPDGRFIASASADRTVRIWNVNYGTIHSVLAGHTDRVTSVAYQPDGSRLASGSGAWGEPGEVRFWKTDTWQLERVIKCDSWVNTVTFAPDGSRLVFGGGYRNLFGAIELNDGFRPITCRSSRNISDEVHSLAFSKDGQMLAIGGQNQTPELRTADFQPETVLSAPLSILLYGLGGLTTMLIIAFFIRRRVQRRITQ